MTPLTWRRPFSSLIRPARFTDTRLAAGIVAAIVMVCLLAVGARLARAQPIYYNVCHSKEDCDRKMPTVAPEDDEATRYYCTHNHSCYVYPGHADCGCDYYTPGTSMDENPTDIITCLDGTPTSGACPDDGPPRGRVQWI